VEDLGPPIAHLALKEGTPVYDRSGERIGVVDRVVTDRDDRIFEGVIIHTNPLPGRHLYATHEQIAELRERGVVLGVEREALEEVGPPARRRRTRHPGESPLHALVRRAWDFVSRLR
jgi:hypothetical protein